MEDQLWLEQLQQLLVTVLEFHKVITKAHLQVLHNQLNLLEPPHRPNLGDLQDLMVKELQWQIHKS
jgi:hypothetical protein